MSVKHNGKTRRIISFFGISGTSWKDWFNECYNVYSPIADQHLNTFFNYQKTIFWLYMTVSLPPKMITCWFKRVIWVWCMTIYMFIYLDKNARFLMIQVKLMNYIRFNVTIPVKVMGLWKEQLKKMSKSVQFLNEV